MPMTHPIAEDLHRRKRALQESAILDPGAELSRGSGGLPNEKLSSHPLCSASGPHRDKGEDHECETGRRTARVFRRRAIACTCFSIRTRSTIDGHGEHRDGDDARDDGGRDQASAARARSGSRCLGSIPGTPTRRAAVSAQADDSRRLAMSHPRSRADRHRRASRRTARAQHTRIVQQDLVDASHTRVHAVEDQEEDPRSHKQDLRGDAESQPEDEERGQHDLRQGVRHGDERGEEPVERTRRGRSPRRTDRDDNAERVAESGLERGQAMSRQKSGSAPTPRAGRRPAGAADEVDPRRVARDERPPPSARRAPQTRG